MARFTMADVDDDVSADELADLNTRYDEFVRDAYDNPECFGGITLEQIAAAVLYEFYESKTGAA